MKQLNVSKLAEIDLILKCNSNTSVVECTLDFFHDSFTAGSDIRCHVFTYFTYKFKISSIINISLIIIFNISSTKILNELFVVDSFSPPAHAHRHQLFPDESQRRRPAHVRPQLHVQLHLHALHR